MLTLTDTLLLLKADLVQRNPMLWAAIPALLAVLTITLLEIVNGAGDFVSRFITGWLWSAGRPATA